jgi:RNA polymerase sigma-70 factor (ECF subfamily)
LTRAFGPENLALAEDVVQETLTRAFEAWSYDGVPEHYASLLTIAARNRALDAFRREQTARKYAPELRRSIESESALEPTVDPLFLPEALKDDQLRMMFSCCDPRLDEEVQVALILKMLCALEVDEIAGAFLATPAAIEKRLSRGKKVLATSKWLFDLTAADFAPRLSAVHRALYLLFSEGYHGASSEAAVRVDICREAMRLVGLLVEHESSATSQTFALAALMYLDAARLPGRVDEAGNLKALFDQDRARWDARLITQGMEFLERSGAGQDLSEYHVEAGIAAIHAAAGTAQETRWGEIVRLYDVLMRIRPSPVVALNRAMAIAQHAGPAAGLEAIRAMMGTGKLVRYPFFPAAMAELELRLELNTEARAHFVEARRLARNDGERQFLDGRIALCEQR